jgi:hypothetical protein
LRIFANQGNDDVAVYNADDPELAGVDLGGCARRVAFCRGAGPDCEVALEGIRRTQCIEIERDCSEIRPRSF